MENKKTDNIQNFDCEKECSGTCCNICSKGEIPLCLDNYKFFLTAKDIPCPDIPEDIKPNKDFKIAVLGEKDDEYDDIPTPDEPDDFEKTDVLLFFKPPYFSRVTDGLLVYADTVLSFLPDFIKEVKKYGYSHMDLDDYYDSTKLSVWKTGGNILLRLCDTERHTILTEELIPQDIFFKVMADLPVLLKSKIEEKIILHQDLYKQFKAMNDFTNSLKWQYDFNSAEEPQEFASCPKDPKAQPAWFKLTDKVKYGRSYVYINGKEINSWWSDEYGYFLREDNTVGRVVFCSDEDKEDIYRFVKSPQFIYKEGMSFKDISKQMYVCGYNLAIDCEYKSKKIKLYANYAVESKNALPEDISEFKKIIKDIFDKSGKDVLDAEDIVMALKNKALYCHYKRTTVKRM